MRKMIFKIAEIAYYNTRGVSIGTMGCKSLRECVESWEFMFNWPPMIIEEWYLELITRQ